MHTHMATCSTALLLLLRLLLLPQKQMPSSAPLHMHKHCQQRVHDLPAGRRPLAPFATPCPSLSLARMLCCLLRGVQYAHMLIPFNEQLLTWRQQRLLVTLS